MVDLTYSNPFVAARAEYFKKLYKAAKDLADAKRSELVHNGSTTLNKDELNTLLISDQVFGDLAYGLDEAMKALSFYANPDTWKEVPEHTYAAQDLGMKAKVALARIDPV